MQEDIDRRTVALAVKASKLTGQTDAITACFSEYTKRVLAKAKDKRPPIREQLEQSAEQARSRPRQHERVKEAARGDR